MRSADPHMRSADPHMRSAAQRMCLADPHMCWAAVLGDYRRAPSMLTLRLRSLRSRRYQFVVTRARNFYLVKIVVPNIMLTYLSFGIFLLDVRCGERLGYGITLLLAMFAVDITASALLPISDAWLWINVLIGVSTIFAVMALAESILVLWLYYKHKDEDAVSPLIDIAKPARMVFNAVTNASAPPQEEEFHDAHDVHSEEAAAKRKRTAREQYLHERNLEQRYVAMGMRLDFFALILFPLFYSVFVLVMFLTASSW
jgi:hypothetical protein